MRRQELVAAIAESAKLSRREADAVLFALTEQITNALARGEAVSLTGFGRFSVTRRAARLGRHPQTGATLAIAASCAPVFKAGRDLKAAVDSRS